MADCKHLRLAPATPGPYLPRQVVLVVCLDCGIHGDVEVGTGFDPGPDELVDGIIVFPEA